MLYLVYVLTFLAGILFYAFSPRDDQAQLNARKGEAFITSFLTQHQAAKDYVTQWLGVRLPDHGGPIPRHFNLTKEDASHEREFEDFIPQAGAIETSDKQGRGGVKQAGTIGANDDWHYQTSVFCVNRDNKMSDVLVDCDAVNALPYLVTYGGEAMGAAGRPDWWPPVNASPPRRYGAWRNSLTSRTHGSYNCGVLTQTNIHGEQQWCVDNGQTVILPRTGECAQKVPRAIAIQTGCIDGAGNLVDECKDSFFCISRIKQGPEAYYAQGLTAFYDSINNQNTGAEGERGLRGGAQVWKDIISGNDATDSAFADGRISSGTGVTFPNFQIVRNMPSPTFFRNFTLTTLLKGLDESKNVAITFLNLNGLEFTLYYTVGDDDSSVKITWLGVPLESGRIPLKANESIVSLTLIGDPNKVSVYVNASSTPVVTLTLADWEAAKVAAAVPTPEVTMRDSFADLIVSSTNDESGNSTEGGYIYGVRYYQSKALNVVGQKKNGRIKPSELEQNFKIDSKRYGISSPKELMPTYM